MSKNRVVYCVLFCFRDMSHFASKMVVVRGLGGDLRGLDSLVQASWGLLGASWGVLGASWEVLNGFWERPGASC